MKQIGSFEIPVFKHGVKIFIGLPDELRPNAAAHTEILFDEQLVNLYFKSRNTELHYVMHECIHAADFILNSIGANMGTNANDSEVRAYLAEYIFSMVGVKLGYAKKEKKNGC